MSHSLRTMLDVSSHSKHTDGRVGLPKARNRKRLREDVIAVLIGFLVAYYVVCGAVIASGIWARLSSGAGS